MRTNRSVEQNRLSRTRYQGIWEFSTRKTGFSSEGKEWFNKWCWQNLLSISKKTVDLGSYYT